MNEPITEAAESPAPLNKKSAAKAFAWTVGVATIVKMVFPLVSVYISRTLGPGQLGIFYILNMIFNLAEIMRDAGLTQTYMADPEMNRKKEGSFHFVAICSALIPFIFLIATAKWMSTIFALPPLQWAIPIVALVCIINGLATIPRAKMLRAGQIVQASTIELIGSGLGLCTAVTLVHLGFDFVALIVQMIVSSTFILVASTIKFPVKSLSPNLQAFRDVGRRAIAVLASNGLNNVFLFSDQAIIGKFVGNVGAGYFGLAANLAYKPADLMVFPLTRTMMVAFSQSSVDLERLARIYARALSVATVFVIPMYAVLAIYGEPIVHILLGDKWLGSVPVLTSMSIYLSARVFGSISGYALVPAGKHSLTLLPWLGCFAITGSLLFFTIPLKQLMPIVWSFTFGAIFVYGVTTALGLIHCKPAANEQSKLRKSIAATSIFVVFALLIRAVPVPSVGSLILVLLLGPIAHLMVIGTIFAGKAFEYLSLSGVKRLYHEF